MNKSPTESMLPDEEILSCDLPDADVEVFATGRESLYDCILHRIGHLPSLAG